MKDELFQSSESVYKKNALDTASVPRVILMLYDRMLLFFNQAKEYSDQDAPQARLYLQQASLVLSHLLRVFLQSDGAAYLDLHQSHESLRQKLMLELQKKNLEYELIDEVYGLLSDYRRSWRQGLQIRLRSIPSQELQENVFQTEIPKEIHPITLSQEQKEVPRLNVRKKLTDTSG